MMNKKNKKIVGVLGLAAAAVATVYAVKNRKNLNKRVEAVKERSALQIHKRIGYPVYEYIRNKNYIPF